MHPLLERARAEGTPLIEGEAVTFLWEGKAAPALLADFTRWRRESSPRLFPEKVAQTLWRYRVTLPLDAYIEYAFFGDPQVEASRLPDPFNPRRVWNGIAHYNNWFDMPAARHTPLTRAARGIARGTVTRHRLTTAQLVVGSARTLWLYQPPVAQPVPLLLVFDGKGYYRQAHLPTIVDNLIAAGRIAPVALAMIDNAGAHRFVEYHTSEAMVATLEPLYHYARGALNLLESAANPGVNGVMGASLGGLMALFTGLRMPAYFGKVLSQAGGFNIAPAQNVAPLIFELVRHLPATPLAIWQDVGTLDWLLETNRDMRDLLLEKGHTVTYREYAAGHNYTAWRNALPEALETLFPPDGNQAAVAM